jgi:hypothetical protein
MNLQKARLLFGLVLGSALFAGCFEGAWTVPDRSSFSTTRVATTEAAGRVLQSQTAPSRPSAISGTSTTIFVTTATSTPVPLRPSQTPTLSQAERATLEAGMTNIAAYEALLATETVILPDCLITSDRSYSPNGSWTAVRCLNNMTGIYNVNDHSIAWQLRYDDLFGMQYDDGHQFGDLKVAHWSRDERFLYLLPHPWGLDGGCPVFHGGRALIKLDLQNGEINYVLEPQERYLFYDVSFSDDDSEMAYTMSIDIPPIINIRNMLDGVEHQFNIGEPFTGAGYVIWSPEKGRVIFSAVSGLECNEQVFYLVEMSLADRHLKVLTEDKHFRFKPLAWLPDNTVWLKSDYFAGDDFLMNLETLVISPYTPEE